MPVRLRQYRILGAFALAAILATFLTASAQEKSAPGNRPVSGKSARTVPDPEPRPKRQADANSPIAPKQALYLIRTALLTLNDANRSGNYSVLRDLAAPDFRNRNTAADLAAIFASLRKRRFDLFIVATEAPRLSEPPTLNASRMLRLKGHFATRPLQIAFDLMFQNVNGQWMLYGISVATPPAPAPVAEGPANVRTASGNRPAPAPVGNGAPRPAR